jgi:iron only hydrogenase large subunit-like protein
MSEYYHVHRVDPARCRGHMVCVRNCPTQAIRLRSGKAVVREDLCIDCGACITHCPAGAVSAESDPVGEISRFKYRVVVPSGVLYTQFDSSVHPYIVHLAFKELGFDEVVDCDTSAIELARAFLLHLQKHKGRLPLISSRCPSMLRLLQVKYPDLVELIAPLDVPRELTARHIRRSFTKKLGLKPEDIGIVYVSPCPAKIVSIKQPAEKATSWFDGAISIRDAYSILLPRVVAIKEKFDESCVPADFFFDAGWSLLGGITREAKTENWLAVSGVSQVMKIFDDIENSRLRNIDFVEALACMLGCVGGPFTVENPYVARSNALKQKARYERCKDVRIEEVQEKLDNGYYHIDKPVLPRPTKYFDGDLVTSIKRMKEIDRIYQKLRQIDCGCCGAPTCKAFAEDCVRGEVNLTDCIFLAEKVDKKVV